MSHHLSLILPNSVLITVAVFFSSFFSRNEILNPFPIINPILVFGLSANPVNKQATLSLTIYLTFKSDNPTESSEF